MEEDAGSQAASLVPEMLGENTGRMLLEEVKRGGYVDSSHQGLAFQKETCGALPAVDNAIAYPAYGMGLWRLYLVDWPSRDGLLLNLRLIRRIQEICPHAKTTRDAARRGSPPCRHEGRKMEEGVEHQGS